MCQTYHLVFSPRGDLTLIRRVCATNVLNLPTCSGVENPKRIPYSGVTTPLLNLLYCIVLETKTMFMLY